MGDVKMEDAAISAYTLAAEKRLMEAKAYGAMRLADRSARAKSNRLARRSATTYAGVNKWGGPVRKSLYRKRRYVRRGYGKRRSFKRRFRGRGDYWDDLRSYGAQALRGFGSLTGGYLGGMLGSSAAGAELGGAAGGWLSRFVGLGDYQMAPFAPELKLNSGVLGSSTDAVTLGNSGQGGRGHIIRHREFLGNVVVPASYAQGVLTGQNGGFLMLVGTNNTTDGSQGMRFQPALPFVGEQGFGTADPPSAFIPATGGMGQWLPQLASQFEEWKPNGVIMEFKSYFSDATQQGSLGNVIMATEYNPRRAPPKDKIHMENMEFSQSCKVSQSMLHPVECARKETAHEELFTRVNNDPESTGQPNDFTAQEYDLASFYLAIDGFPIASMYDGTNYFPVTIGELWCSYEVEMLKPQLLDTSVTPVGGQLLSQQINIVQAGPIVTYSGDNICTWTNVSGFDYLTVNIAGTYLVTGVNVALGAAPSDIFLFICTDGATTAQLYPGDIIADGGIVQVNKVSATVSGDGIYGSYSNANHQKTCQWIVTSPTNGQMKIKNANPFGTVNGRCYTITSFKPPIGVGLGSPQSGLSQDLLSLELNGFGTPASSTDPFPGLASDPAHSNIAFSSTLGGNVLELFLPAGAYTAMYYGVASSNLEIAAAGAVVVVGGGVSDLNLFDNNTMAHWVAPDDGTDSSQPNFEFGYAFTVTGGTYPISLSFTLPAVFDGTPALDGWTVLVQRLVDL